MRKRLEAVYFVPRDEDPRIGRLSGIIWALTRCQTFFQREGGILLDWRLLPPVFGKWTRKEYEDLELLFTEISENIGEPEIVGVFFEGFLHGGAFGNEGWFVIAEPYLHHLERRRFDAVVAHEIGHALGLPDRSDLSIMGLGPALGGLRRKAIFPRHRAHLSREDREALRRRW